MPKLYELAELIRSKNAGPFALTIDIMFAEEPTYRRVLDSGVLSEALFERLYGTPAEDVRVIPYAPALAIKITIPRPVASGDLQDGDVLGGQQYGPLVELDIP